MGCWRPGRTCCKSRSPGRRWRTRSAKCSTKQKKADREMSRTTKDADARDRPRGVVVVVEDDPDLREIYAEYLEGKGFSVARAANGLEALLQIKRARPASVVLDLLMPRLGGLEALRRIKAFDPSIVVVVVTGARDPDLRLQALAVGASAVLDKPVTPQTLLVALTEGSRSGPPVSDPPKTAAAALATPPALAGRVLVVDDEAEVRRPLEDFLTPKGYR